MQAAVRVTPCFLGLNFLVGVSEGVGSQGLAERQRPGIALRGCVVCTEMYSQMWCARLSKATVVVLLRF